MGFRVLGFRVLGLGIGGLGFWALRGFTVVYGFKAQGLVDSVLGFRDLGLRAERFTRTPQVPFKGL